MWWMIQPCSTQRRRRSKRFTAGALRAANFVMLTNVRHRQRFLTPMWWMIQPCTRHAAATKIQALHRGHMARQSGIARTQSSMLTLLAAALPQREARGVNTVLAAVHAGDPRGSTAGTKGGRMRKASVGSSVGSFFRTITSSSSMSSTTVESSTASTSGSSFTDSSFPTSSSSAHPEAVDEATTQEHRAAARIQAARRGHAGRRRASQVRAAAVLEEEHFRRSAAAREEEAMQRSALLVAAVEEEEGMARGCIDVEEAAFSSVLHVRMACLGLEQAGENMQVAVREEESSQRSALLVAAVEEEEGMARGCLDREQVCMACLVLEQAWERMRAAVSQNEQGGFDRLVGGFAVACAVAGEAAGRAAVEGPEAAGRACLMAMHEEGCGRADVAAAWRVGVLRAYVACYAFPDAPHALLLSMRDAATGTPSVGFAPSDVLEVMRRYGDGASERAWAEVKAQVARVLTPPDPARDGGCDIHAQEYITNRGAMHGVARRKLVAKLKSVVERTNCVGDLEAHLGTASDPEAAPRGSSSVRRMVVLSGLVGRLRGGGFAALADEPPHDLPPHGDGACNTCPAAVWRCLGAWCPIADLDRDVAAWDAAWRGTPACDLAAVAASVAAGFGGDGVHAVGEDPREAEALRGFGFDVAVKGRRHRAAAQHPLSAAPWLVAAAGDGFLGAEACAVVSTATRATLAHALAGSPYAPAHQEVLAVVWAFAGAHLGAEDAAGCTPLHAAAASGRADVFVPVYAAWRMTDAAAGWVGGGVSPATPPLAPFAPETAAASAGAPPPPWCVFFSKADGLDGVEAAMAACGVAGDLPHCIYPGSLHPVAASASGWTPLHGAIDAGAFSLASAMVAVALPTGAVPPGATPPLASLQRMESSVSLASTVRSTDRRAAGVGTPLHVLAASAAWDEACDGETLQGVVAALVERGFAADADADGATPFLAALRGRRCRAAAALLDAAGRAALPSRSRGSVLHELARAPSTAPFRTLFDTVMRYVNGYGGRTCLTNRDAHGNTPLHTAAGAGNAYVVEALLAADAVPHALNNANQTPFHLACRAAGAYVESAAQPAFFTLGGLGMGDEACDSEAASVVLAQRDVDTATPLHCALASGCRPLAEALAARLRALPAPAREAAAAWLGDAPVEQYAPAAAEWAHGVIADSLTES
eukprot:TRINITY_DN2149_c0_g1_i4.p1 TRINITY_DN2149_c0_g1~~TRINITY_DN2149_c0_g1_i4.p1  ORF type:complete len:1163 (+),score=274.29 TRINITY_DN2149_c0_g1_i4:163-3651(+)